MQVWFWLWLVVALKIPVAGACWLIWHAIKQQPEQVVGGSGTGGDGGGDGPGFDQGPRRRGPGDTLRPPPAARSRGGRHDRAERPRESETAGTRR